MKRWLLSQDLTEMRELTLYLQGRVSKTGEENQQVGSGMELGNGGGQGSKGRSQADDRVLCDMDYRDLVFHSEQFVESLWGAEQRSTCHDCSGCLPGTIVQEAPVEARRPVEFISEIVKSVSCFSYKNKLQYLLVFAAFSPSIILTSAVFWNTTLNMWLAHFKISMVACCLQNYVQPLSTNVFKIWPQSIFPD